MPEADTASTGKDAASKVFIPTSVAAVVEGAVTEVKVDADARVAQAEAFGVPDQNQTPHPLFGPVGGRMDNPPPPPVQPHP